MIQGLYSALSAINTGTQLQNITANNIANVNTPGFQGSMSVLGDLSNGGAQILSITQNGNTGYLIRTDQPFDMAINGDGYFQLDSGNGFEYTRNGSFRQDVDGNLVDSNGSILIELPEDATDISIGADGTITSGDQFLGNISIFDQSGNQLPTNNYEILSGYLEGSNVDITKEIVDNMINLRYVQANSKTINAVDEMMGTIIDMKS